MSDKRKVILDCDPGHDDAFAIRICWVSPRLVGTAAFKTSQRMR